MATESYQTIVRMMDDEGVPTKTSEDQKNQEDMVSKFTLSDQTIYLKHHFQYLIDEIETLSFKKRFKECFSPWDPFYSLFSLRALSYPDHEKLQQICSKCAEFYRHRKMPSGVFSGFPLDNPHLVTNYAAVHGIILIGSEEAYNLVDRKAFYNFLLSLKKSDGSFSSSIGEESDIRSTFSAILIAYILNILTPELTLNVKQFVLSCSNYDGGFGPKHGCESHGGYVHCAIGIMKMLDGLDELDLSAVIRWISSRQMEYSGGFQGRTNKLADSCYTWWIGSAARIISDHLHIPPFWNDEAITSYIVRTAQDALGGFCDHPPSNSDTFHTLYSLAGLCVCGIPPSPSFPALDPLIAAPIELARQALEHFSHLPSAI